MLKKKNKIIQIDKKVVDRKIKDNGTEKFMVERVLESLNGCEHGSFLPFRGACQHVVAQLSMELILWTALSSTCDNFSKLI